MWGELLVGDDYIEFINRLCNEYGEALYQYAARRIHNPEMVKDLVQEVFLLLTIQVAHVYTHQNPPGWLFKVLENLILRELKKSQHSEVSLLSEELAQIGRPDEHFFQLLPCGLTDSEQELLVLRIEKKWDYETIAEYKGLTIDACRQRMSRAIRKCRKLLQQEDK